MTSGDEEKDTATTQWSDKIVELDKLINEEELKWVAQGASPMNLEIPTFMLDCKIGVMAEIMMDRGLVTEQEFLVRLKTLVLENMISARKEVVEPAIRKSRQADILQGIANPLMAPSINSKKPRLH